MPVETLRDAAVTEAITLQGGAGAVLDGYGAAFLVSRYPAVSHTFILREVLALRALGLQIETASINDDDRDPGRLSVEEQTETARTFYVKRSGWRGAILSHCKVAFGMPRTYLRGLTYALRTGSEGVRGIIYSLFYFTEALMIGCWMRQQHLSHLHVHFGSAGATVGLLACHTFRFRYSLTIHGPDEFFDVGHFRLKEKFAAASFICCISSYARSQVFRLLPEADWAKVHVARLGVDVNRFAPAIRSESHDPLRIVCVGRLVETKGQAVLLDAVAQLRGEGIPVSLQLIGDGPSRNALRELAQKHQIESHVTFAGAVNPEAIVDLLRSSEAFVLPSFAEGIPVALMEAMAMELPCVTTFVNGIPELIEDNVDGLIVPPADVAALAQAIGKLAADPNLRLRLGKAGRTKVLRNYHLKTNASRLAEVWLQCLQQQAVEE